MIALRSLIGRDISLEHIATGEDILLFFYILDLCCYEQLTLPVIGLLEYKLSALSYNANSTFSKGLGGVGVVKIIFRAKFFWRFLHY